MSEDVRWHLIDLCGDSSDPWDGDFLADEWTLYPKVRRYCPSCGQVVRVRQESGQVYIPLHSTIEKDGYMTTCEASRTEQVLEPAP